MSTIYTFRKPLDMMRQLASALTIRHCITSGSGTDAEVSSYIFSQVVPTTFESITQQHFRNVDSMISAVAPYFCDSNGSRWNMTTLESACSAEYVLPMAIKTPLPAEWLGQRMDMISKLNIAGGGVMTKNIDGYAEGTNYNIALSSALSVASAGGTYEDYRASRCLIFDQIGSDYCVSATLTVSGSALSPTDTAVWGNPSRVFRMSASQGVHETFLPSVVAFNGGTMSIVEGVNIINAGTAGTYRFLNPTYISTSSHEDAGMDEEADPYYAQVLLFYDI